MDKVNCKVNISLVEPFLFDMLEVQQMLKTITNLLCVYDMIRYGGKYLTCSKNLTDSRLI